jgi:hypothetical protein
MFGPVPSLSRRRKRFLDRGLPCVKMKGGFEQLPNYIKGIGEPCCTPDLLAFSRKRRALASEPSSIARTRPSATPPTRYRNTGFVPPVPTFDSRSHLFI